MRVREKYSPYGIRKPLGLADSLRQRREMGICETCNQGMETHDRCEACCALCGPWHDCHLAPYLGHDVCWNCNMDWHKKEFKTGKLISFEDFRGHEVLGRPRKG